MKRWLAVLVVLALVATGVVYVARPPGPSALPAPEKKTTPERKPGDIVIRPPPPPRREAATPLPPPALSEAEKNARLEKIRRDYDDIRTKASADYAALGPKFPGGLNAFLRQLALLELEKRKDYAAFLPPRELEDILLKETNAGQLVTKLLGDLPVSDEQRRTVFRLQLAFDDAHAMTFDLTPAALFRRETARQQLQEQVRGVLGDQGFAAWLRGEGGEFAQFQQFAAEQGLPGSAAFDLWRAKNEFTRRRLEINSQGLQGPQHVKAAQLALIEQTETRVFSIVGPNAMPLARQRILDWLPKK